MVMISSPPYIPPGEYNSGWFACANDTNYTKAHGLGVIPDEIEVLFATSASPTTVYQVCRTAYGGSDKGVTVKADATNITVHTENAFPIDDSANQAFTSGFLKIIARKIN